MSNISDFHIIVSGPAVSVGRFRDSFEIGLRGKSNDGDSIVDCSPWWKTDQNNSENQRSHFWVRSLTATPTTVTIVGESRWTPPVEIVQFWSGHFPNLTFLVMATTEHEYYESWRVTGGNASLVELWEEDIQKGTEIHYCDGGKQLLDFPKWFSTPLDLDQGDDQ